MNTHRLAGVPALSMLILVTAMIGRASATSHGDFDDDGDIDLADFGRFQACTLGSNVPQEHPQCAPARLDADQDVDLDDLAVFVGCFRGAQVPVDPSCACPSGQMMCAGACVSTASDNANCGACGVVCATGQICQRGTCLAPCSPPLVLCSGVCVDLTYNNANCGSCGHMCVGDLTCVGGVCSFISEPAQPCRDCRGDAEAIPGDFDGDGDVDLADFAKLQACMLGPDVPQTDPACADARLDAGQDVDLDDLVLFHGCLSGAGNPADRNCICQSDETNCSGTCVNTVNDEANCGSCGYACADGLLCQNGSCAVCAGGSTLCSGICTHVGFDPLNCGGCGISCPENETCSGGTCQSPWRSAVSIPGDLDDDGDADLADFAGFQACALGRDIAQTNAECGDARIDADQDVDLDDFEIFGRCLSGAGHPVNPDCACAAGQASCDGTCVSMTSDEANCGSCGNVCAPGHVCQGGTCNPCASADGRYALCGETCVDTWINTAHCGGCSMACAGGQNCVGGTCEDAEPCWDCGRTTSSVRPPTDSALSRTEPGAPSDFDLDGDVDMADFAHFQKCALGRDIPQPTPECSDSRLDADQDVDRDDFQLLLNCFSGEGQPADPNCACPVGQSSCSGTCVNTTSDNANCGTCGNACPAGLNCSNGACATCSTGGVLCGSECVDLLWDGRNCGYCGHVCPELTACAWGTCEGLCVDCP